MLDIRSFGAVGDNSHDDTAAMQAAIDKAAETGETVYVGPGEYLCDTLYMRPKVYIKSDPLWGFRRDELGRAIIRQRSDGIPCLLDLTECHGSTIDGLCLDGRGTGDTVGMLSRKPDYGKKEDAYRIENCKVSGFGSHAVFLDHIWCFSVRHCMFAFSGGHGLAINGWDGFILDNWFSGNKGAGFASIGANASCTLTGNRIEWNRGGGIVIHDGSHYNITGNYIDRSGDAGIELVGARIVAATGNVVYRSGKFRPDDRESTQILLDGCKGVTFTGNSMNLGRDDGGKGDITPSWGMRIKDLTDCAVIGNVMFNGGTVGTIDDMGGHKNSVIDSNVGRAAASN